mmetsp:Transcript_46408/g.148216  ORF Transcript_46408/g.148216 Transcript_46408/m.148216 type:complete len:720 (-) Transcript_46408:19-2178(-)
MAARKRGKFGGEGQEQQKCTQCRQWSSDGDWDGRKFYCTRCCAKYERQADGDEYHSIGTSSTGEDAEFLNEYKSKWRELIELEWQEELRLVNERLKNWSLDRLVRQGYCITDLKGTRRGQFFGKEKISFTKDFIGKHQFTSGDEVLVSRRNPLEDTSSWKGEVVELGQSRITIVAMDAHRDLGVGAWRLDCGANKTAYERTKEALGYMTGHKYKQKGIRRLVLQEDPRELRDVRAPGTAARAAERLNETQVAAIEGVENKSLGLIQGPPGTGKTTTTCVMIKRMVEMHKQSGVSCNILVSADSNVAVDQLLEGLLNLGVNALRIGFPSKVSEQLRDHTLLAKFESHELSTKVEETREALQKVKDDLYGGHLKGKGKGLAHRDIQWYVKELIRLQRQMTDELIESADVICSTLIGCGSDVLLQKTFPVVIIDEASQATEPRCLVAIQKAEAQIIMVGDQQQLPPVVVCKEAEAKGLRYSLFDRLLKSSLFQGQLHMLKVQYRMHPLIRQWPSDTFYGGSLQDGPQCTTDRHFTAFPKPVTFIDTSRGLAHAFLKGAAQRVRSVAGGYNVSLANEERQYSEGSKYNLLEVEVVRLCLDIVLQAGTGISPSDVGVISPYTAQISEIKSALERSGGLDSGGRYHRVEVKTVDGYQGREKEVIILSCVRTQGLGFLTDYRRLNVGITRAKRGLVVIGCSELLSQDDTWRSYLRFLESEGLGVPL